MKASGLVVVSVLTMLGACSGEPGPTPTPIPPANETSPRIPAIQDAVKKNEPLLKEPIEDHLRLLESTIASIAEKHGDESVEVVQALTETAALLSTKGRLDLALPFMERSLELSREVYGLDHRETAFALHDVAVVLTDAAADGYDPRAELLYRGAVEVRRRQAGVDHPETAASETQLAWQLLLGARRESLPYRKYPMLAEAEHLALHAERVFDEHEIRDYSLKIRRTLIETAFARADYSEVQKRARALLQDRDYEKGPGLYPDATAQDLLMRAIELQMELFKNVELPKARGLQDSGHEKRN